MARSVVVTHDGDDDTPMPSSADEPVTLKALLENLGRDVIQVAAAPLGLDVPVGEPVIYDAAELAAISRNAVVLAIGVPARDARAATADRGGGAGGGCGRRSSRRHRIWTSSLAVAARLAASRVLSVPEEMTWTQLHALLDLSRFSTVTGAAAGIAGVPLGDLFALANAIAGMVGGAVTIEDPARRVLAYSTLGDQPIDAARRGSILGRQVPDSPGMRTLYRQVLVDSRRDERRRATRCGEILEGGLAEIDDVKPRSAVAIRAGEPDDRIDLGHPRRRPARRGGRACARRGGAHRRATHDPGACGSRRRATAAGRDAAGRARRATAPPRRPRRGSASRRRPARRARVRARERRAAASTSCSESGSSTSSSLHCEAIAPAGVGRRARADRLRASAS